MRLISFDKPASVGCVRGSKLRTCFASETFKVLLDESFRGGGNISILSGRPGAVVSDLSTAITFDRDAPRLVDSLVLFVSILITTIY